MENNANNPSENDETGQEDKGTDTSRPASAMDLSDSPDDEKHMQEEEVILDLPDVNDIPGQEHIHVPLFGEMSDTTISSDDEEGVGLFEDETDDEESGIIMGTDADVSPGEEKELQTTAEDMPTQDDSELRDAALDNTDTEGDPLNEGSFDSDVSGEDLDTPGSEDDNPDEAVGEEDEENNPYSLGGDEKDDVPGDAF